MLNRRPLVDVNSLKSYFLDLENTHVICDTCVFIEFLGSCRLAALKERLMCRLNREPVFISIFLDREMDVEIDVVVAETSSDDPLARLGFWSKSRTKTLYCWFRLFVKAAALSFPSKHGA